MSDEYRLSVVESSVKNTEITVRRATDNVAFVGLGRQTDSRYLTVMTHLGQQRRELSQLHLLDSFVSFTCQMFKLVSSFYVY